MSSLSDYKKQRQERLQALDKEVEKITKRFQPDERFWKPLIDKSGSAAAIIRFLDAPKGETLPYARVLTHNFKGPGGWYIEKCLLTLGKQDPCNDLNKKLWATQLESNQDQARKQKVKVKFYSNILVIKDPKNPENEGKVFLYGYGKKIFDKINSILHPVDDGLGEKEQINPFDLYEGCNFILRAKTVSGFVNYDASEFEKPSALFDGDDDKIAEVYDACYSLTQFTDPSSFKSYDELKKVLDRVTTGRSSFESTTASDVDVDVNQPARKVFSTSEEEYSSAYTKPKKQPEVTADDDLDFGDDDLDLESLASLADAE